MPYVSTGESVGLARGLKKGIESVLRVRFGEAGIKLITDDLNNYEDDQLEAILKALETAENLDEARRILSPTPA